MYENIYILSTFYKIVENYTLQEKKLKTNLLLFSTKVVYKMGNFALQISSYEIEKNNWLLLEVIVNKFSDIVDGFEATAIWRDGSFYVPIGDSTNLRWKEQNTLKDWQEKVNDVPSWPKLEEDEDTYWVAVTPINEIEIDGEQKVMFITKKAGQTTNAQCESKHNQTAHAYETPDVSDEEGCSSRDMQRLQKKTKKTKKTKHANMSKETFEVRSKRSIKSPKRYNPNPKKE